MSRIAHGVRARPKRLSALQSDFGGFELACCILVSLFVGGIWERATIRLAGPPAPGPSSALGGATQDLRRLLGPRWVVWLATIAVAEVGAAALVSWVLFTHDSARMLEPSHASRYMASMSAGIQGVSLDPQVPFLAIAVTCVVAVCGFLLCAQVSPIPGSRSRHSLPNPLVLAAVGVSLYAIALAPPLSDLAGSSHAAWMTQTMIVMVAAPALVATAIARTRAGSPLNPDAVRIALVLGAIAYVTVLYLWHLPAFDAWIADNPDAWRWRYASYAIAGLSLFCPLVHDSRLQLVGARLSAVVAVALPSGLLGLSLLLTRGPSSGASLEGSGWLTDDRLAGAFMMAVDGLALVQLSARLAKQLRAGIRTYS
jgi:Cytochrome c oxidase caa3 assembly factor (Caa3_CtaG)